MALNGAFTSVIQLTLTNAGTPSFGAWVTLGGALVQTNAATGTTTFGGPVTAASATLRGAAFNVNDSLTTTGALNLTASGATTFGGPASAASATLNGTSFDVNNSFTTTGALNVTNSGTFTKNATGDINAGGGVAISGNVSVTNSIITGNSAVSIGGATALTGATTVSTGTGDVTFTGAVTGNQALSVNSTGTTTFASPVSIGSLATNAGGTTAINGGAVTTTGAQTYGDAVTLGTNTIFASTGNADIAFNNTLNGGVTVDVNTGGVTRFLAPVGGGVALTSLTTDAGGTTDLNGGAVTTTGAQTYNDAVTLTANTTLTSNTAGITFVNNVNSDATARTLTLSAPGTVTFTGNVGNTAALADLDVNAGGILFNGPAAQTVTVNVNGGTANTVTFNAPVVLGQNVTINTDGPGVDNNVTFTNRINADTAAGARSLTVTTGGGTSTFQQGIGAGTADRELFAVTLAGANAGITGDVLVNGGGNVDLQGVTNLAFSDGAKIDTDRSGGTTAAGNVLMAATTKANPPATQTALVTWSIDATADGGAASGNVQLGTIGDVTPLQVLNVFGESVNVLGPVKATQIAVTANSVATDGAGVLIASKEFANDSAITNAAVKLQGLTGAGIFGTVDHFLQIQAPGLFVVVPNESNALPVVFLGGDPSLKPVYEFASDPSKRVVLYNGVAPDSPAARAALGAALAPLREVISEVLLAGFAKENIRRQLVQGQVLETGLARPGIDEFTGEGVQQQPSCPGSPNAASNGAIACQ
jgi:hypothetical protein